MIPQVNATRSRPLNTLRSTLVWVLSTLCVGIGFQLSGAQNTNVFELLEGDRVVLLGDTLIEREQAYAFAEVVLTTHYPDRNVTFRNLGWSADTPQGQSRAGFDHDKSPDLWFAQLTNSIAQLKPTVVLLGYGMADS